MAERDYVVASKVGEVSQLLYPDIHSAGGLVGLVRRWFESLDPEARVTGISATEENRWCAASARVDVQDRFSQIHVADKQRLFWSTSGHMECTWQTVLSSSTKSPLRLYVAGLAKESGRKNWHRVSLTCQ